MFDVITQSIQQDKDFPDRVYRHEILTRILNGTLYDNLAYEFHTEKRGSGEYVPMRQRKPSVRYNMSKIVVDDSVNFLMGEGRFPAIDSSDETTRNTMHLIVKHHRIQQLMIEAATRGSIGSVAILMRILNFRLYFEVLPTQYLIPTYDPQAPDTLLKVREKYKVKGQDLLDMGYNIPDENLRLDYWYMRDFDQISEIYYLPVLVSDAKEAQKNNKNPFVPDPERQAQHKLGFVPVVWIKNLPSVTNSKTDGACTFEQAIHTQIEIEYQLSQAGRALKYSADPMLLIKENNPEDGKPIQRDASNALVVGTEGDARLLEIDGSASQAVIDYCRTLRELALETIHGNRSPIDKLSLPQSGRAMEILYQPLILLADTLRGSYGEYGLLALLKMIQRASAQMPLIVGDQTIPRLDPKVDLSLRWANFFSPTDTDRVQQSQALAELVGGGLMSRETAVKVLAERYDINDVAAELTLIEADMKAAQEAAAAVDAKHNLVVSK